MMIERAEFLTPPNVPGHLDGRAPEGRLLRLSVVCIAVASFGDQAMAGCIQGNDIQPAPPQTYNFANQTFSASRPYFFVTGASNGCDAPAQGANGRNGEDGGNGQLGTQITSTNTSVSIFGGVPGIGGQTSAATIQSFGGVGGTGGQAGPSFFVGSTYGGAGGIGGSGGPLSVQFNGTLFPSSANTLADIGLLVGSDTGGSGSGGPSTSISTVDTYGGPGRPGRVGSPVDVIASGAYSTIRTGILAFSTGGSGGSGGLAYSGETLENVYGGDGGGGAAGGPVSLRFTGGSVQAGQFGLSANSLGGSGGNGGGTAKQAGTTGGPGGVGGAGGAVSISLSGGSVAVVRLAGSSGLAASIYAASNGNDGGAGGLPGGALGAGGGTGGNGGQGGPATVAVTGSVNLTGPNRAGAADGVGVLVQSNGGRGGPGGNESSIVGKAGGGGFAGSGGAATLSVGTDGAGAATGTVVTSGNFAHGALVQSVGGGGGSGGQAEFGGGGGDGGIGGNGGAAGLAVANGRIVTLGSNSVGAVAQSIGGGGGSGGDARGVEVVSAFVVGGNGGQGGDGGNVTVNLGNAVIGSSSLTRTDKLPTPNGGGGVLAQSIGGAGGNAGSATSTGGGLVAIVIGGDAGPGGDGGAASVGSAGLVTTFGDHAAGIQAQSIGGGGGKGGSVTNFSASPVPTAAISVGGRGGSGGAGGPVAIQNSGQVATYGPDAIGILMQSIGGGGGSGGSAAASAVSLSPSKYIPAVSVAVALGGAGGAGGSGSTVRLDNSGLVTTGGDGAIGVMAQSVGGGGGNGGDSSAASYSNGRQSAVNLSVSVAVGGSGGNGGAGGTVTQTNSGVIATLGQDAYGVFAQSVGGGGGLGGAGDATATAGGAKLGFSASVDVGGRGGSGGDGGAVSLTNTGAITTAGDGADAVFAQSVGGGGGAGGGGVGTANGSKMSVAVTLGGSGGVGGAGNTVTASNAGSIVTRGTDANGLSLQSIGGGGGKAGKGGSTAGGVNPVSNAGSLFDILGKGLGFNKDVQDLGDGIIRIGQVGQEIKATFMELAGIFSQPQGGPAGIGAATQLNVSVSVGGQGGAGGDGGAVNATNTGTIATFGAQSDGIFAQSVGGGGGSGGAATSTSKAGSDTPVQTSVSVGGHGAGAGNGGTVTVMNTAGAVTTQGVLAFGVLAQSVGGGGGDGATAGALDGSLKSFALALGGDGGRGGNGGQVNVTAGDGPNGGITTTGKNAVAIVAQSVGGGGGLIRNMTTDQTFDPSKILNNPQGRLGDVQGFSLTLGGVGGASGSGGPVGVTVGGPITTAGRGAHGIVAQSIGGGGGLVGGGQLLAAAGGTGISLGGLGGAVSVKLQPGARIVTGADAATYGGGDGAYGILAQSIGGGGGIAGDLANVQSGVKLGVTYTFQTGIGGGGSVDVALQGASVTTSGSRAPAIFAQSVGGGGGLAAPATTGSNGSFVSVLQRGSAGGPGVAGAVTVALTDSAVAATGPGSAGILAQSDGALSRPITVSLDRTSSVLGGRADPTYIGSEPPTQRDAAAVRLLGGSANRIDNAGAITGANGGFAILTDTPQGNTVLTNTGTVTGAVIYNSGAGNLVDNRPGGVVQGASVLDLHGGLFRNGGTLRIDVPGTTTLTGDLVQTATGTIIAEIDQAAGTANRLQVVGRATIAGSVLGVATTTVRLTPGATRYALITATGGIVRDATATAIGGTPVVRYDLVQTDANTLSLDRTIDLGGSRTLTEQNLASSNRNEVGRALNVAFSGDPAGLATLGGRLATIPSSAALAATLDALSGEAVADVQQTVFATQQLYNITLARHVTDVDGGMSVRPYGTAALGAVAPPTNDQGLRVWVGGLGGSDVLDGNDGRGSLHTQIAGGLIGLDKSFDANRMVGISIGGGSTDFSVANRGGSGHGTTVQVGTYGLASYGKAYVAGVASYGNVDSTIRRLGLGGATGLVAASRASVNSDVLGARVEAGWRQPVGPVTLTPFAALEVDHIWQAPVTETAIGPDAAGLGLCFARQERTSVPLTLGGRVGTTVTVAGGRTLALSAEVGWMHEFNTTRSLRTAFLAAPGAAFRVLGADAAADAAVLGLKGTLALTRTVAIVGNFNGRFSGTETAVGGFGGVQITW